MPQVNSKQKQMLLEFLKKNKNVATGAFTNTFTKKECLRIWEELSLKLNSIPGGAQKDGKTWRKTWHDLRNRVKTKRQKINLKKNRTGSGTDPYDSDEEDMTALERDILDFISEVSIEGAKGVAESPLDNMASNVPASAEPMEEKSFYSLLDNREDSETDCGVNDTPSHIIKTPRKRVLTTSVAVQEYKEYCDKKLLFLKEFQNARITELQIQSAALTRMAEAQEQQAASNQQNAQSRARLVNALESIAESLLEQKV